MAGHEWEDWFEREEFIGQISDMRVQNLQVEREVVQKRTFTRWMNLHLEKCDPPIEVHDLFRDIQDGHILMALLEELSGCKLLHGFKKSAHRIFRLNNIAKVLSFLEERNVKLVSIDAADVADGNSSIILGLIWNIILFFQIKELTGNIRSQFPSCSSLSSIPTSSDSDMSFCSTPSDERQSASTAMREHSKAIKKLLQWVQKRTRKYGVAVQGFGKCWTSGLAFLAVIKSIDPSLVDMRKALLRTARENLEDAFRIAHYSLGIPRLLEPEDLTINAPDEQSIIIYVSQFLEHFPGIEELEETTQLIERSVSLCRLNFRDTDSHEHMRNGTHRSIVKERSYMFQKDQTKPPPRILISSVSEDRSAMSPPFRAAAARSWSSEDILADSSHMDIVEDLKKPSGEVLKDSDSNSSQPPCTPLPSDSSVPESLNTESVIGDSAISSPDSWVSEFGVMPEKLCGSQSDSSLCDSGTAWDVYRATPVEITNSDEGFVPAMEDRPPAEQQSTESYIDEGIYSLSSLECTQECTEGNFDKKQVKEVQEKVANLDNHTQDGTLEQVPDLSKAENTKEENCKPIDTSLLQKSKVPREQEPSTGNQSPLNTTEVLPTEKFEELLKQTSVEESTDKEPGCSKKALDYIGDEQVHEGLINSQTESQEQRSGSEEVVVITECEKTDSPSDETKGESKEESGILKEEGERLVDIHGKASEGVIKDIVEPQETTNQDGAAVTGQDTGAGINIPLISISSESEEKDKDQVCDVERQEHAEEHKVNQDETSRSKGIEKDANSHQIPDEPGRTSNENEEKNLVDIPSCILTENDKAEQIRDTGGRHLDDTDEGLNEISRSSDSGTKVENVESSEAKPECQNDPLDGHKYRVGDTISDEKTLQATSDLVASKQNGTAGILSFKSQSMSEDRDNPDFDQNSPADDLVGDPIEPMDLFYPDKEEPMFTEPPDTEMQSWPSVLSVSALQPAPPSEALLLDEQPLELLGEDFRNGGNLIQTNDKVVTDNNQETDKAPESQEQCLLLEEKIGLWGGAPADSRDLSEAELQSLCSARENTEPVRKLSKSPSRGAEENQIPPVLRHRKGARFTESTDGQRAVTAANRQADDDSEFWWSENPQLYLLLLLWLLLYCFWLLPQMDLKTLPSLLLNIKH